MLRRLPFDNKIDEAKARSFLSGIRDVLGAKNVDLEAQSRQPKYWQPDTEPRADPEDHKAGLREARRILKKGPDDADLRESETDELE